MFSIRRSYRQVGPFCLFFTCREAARSKQKIVAGQEKDPTGGQAGGRISIGDIEIDSFTVPHDAIDPVGFTLRAEGVRIGIVTDLGYVTDSIKVHLRGVDVLLLEANHDLEMLKVGPYPWSVKQRVMGRKGHLSNEVACNFIRKDLDTSVHMLILGHLSENNNHPEIVRSMAARSKRTIGVPA